MYMDTIRRVIKLENIHKICFQHVAYWNHELFTDGVDEQYITEYITQNLAPVDNRHIYALRTWRTVAEDEVNSVTGYHWKKEMQGKKPLFHKAYHNDRYDTRDYLYVITAVADNARELVDLVDGGAVFVSDNVKDGSFFEEAIDEFRSETNDAVCGLYDIELKRIVERNPDITVFCYSASRDEAIHAYLADDDSFRYDFPICSFDIYGIREIGNRGNR
jgi:hypothetical protein